jgi:uncharacterized protein YbbK (DUF523 family)
VLKVFAVLNFNKFDGSDFLPHNKSKTLIPLLQKPLKQVAFVPCLVLGLHVPRTPSQTFMQTRVQGSFRKFPQRQNVTSDDDSGMGKWRLVRPAPPTSQSHFCVLAESVSSGFCLWERL